MLMNKLNECLYYTSHDDIDHQIAKYLKRNLASISDMTIDELAKSCYVSKAKVSKFCKTLGYDNFIAFKDDCAREIKAKKLVIKTQRENLEIDYLDHLNQSFKAIETNLALIDKYKIEQLIKDIASAKQIFIYGIAYSKLLAQYLQYESDFLDKEVIVMDEKLIKNYVLKDDSLLIVISVEGRGLSDQRLSRRLKKYSTNKWIISTDKIENQLLSGFNNCLIVGTNNTEMKDRRLLLRYLIDIIIGRYQYLYK